MKAYNAAEKTNSNKINWINQIGKLYKKNACLLPKAISKHAIV